MKALLFILPVATLLTGTACSLIPQATQDPTRYYVLTTPAIAPAPPAAPANRVAVSLRSIELPSYLRNSRNIVVRSGPNEVRYEDFSRWAEPLDTAVQRVLREHLISAPPVRALVSPPFSPDEPRDFDVRVRVLACEGSRGPEGTHQTAFSASYEIVRVTGSGQEVVRKTFTAAPLPWDGQDFGALAARLSENVGELADAIVASLPAR